MNTPIIQTAEELELVLKHIKLPRPKIDWRDESYIPLSKENTIEAIKGAYASIINESVVFFEIKSKL